MKLVTERAPVGNEFVGRLAGALASRHFLRAGIPCGLALLDRLDEQAPVAFQSFTPVELRSERVEGTAPPHRLAQIVETLADQPHVVHQNVGIESATSDLYPQLASPTERT